MGQFPVSSTVGFWARIGSGRGMSSPRESGTREGLGAGCGRFALSMVESQQAKAGWRISKMPRGGRVNGWPDSKTKLCRLMGDHPGAPKDVDEVKDKRAKGTGRFTQTRVKVIIGVGDPIFRKSILASPAAAQRQEHRAASSRPFGRRSAKHSWTGSERQWLQTFRERQRRQRGRRYARQ